MCRGKKGFSADSVFKPPVTECTINLTHQGRGHKLRKGARTHGTVFYTLLHTTNSRKRKPSSEITHHTLLSQDQESAVRIVAAAPLWVPTSARTWVPRDHHFTDLPPRSHFPLIREFLIFFVPTPLWHGW